MKSEHLEAELIDYIKNELTPDERAAADKHLAECEACRKELQGMEQTFAALQRELIPIELSAHFRIALADQLDEATNATAQQPPRPTAVLRQSERHIRDMQKPVITRIWEHARRSPYFAASLMAHAAALLIIFAILLKMRTMEAEPVRINPEPEKVLVLNQNLRTKQQAYNARWDADQIRTTAEFVKDGLRVDLSQLMILSGETLVMVGDDELGCVRGYTTNAEEGLTKESLLQEHPKALVRRVEDARVTIPNALTSYLKASNKLFVFRMKGRLEFWSQPVWNELRRKYKDPSFARARLDKMDMILTALLPRKEEI